MSDQLATTITAAIDDRSARGIAAGVGRLITAGALPIGGRLPTVRELSQALGVSPTTVSEAWQTLAAVGAIDARGRQGTFVREPTGSYSPRRYRRVTEGPGHFVLDLSTGTPDPALLPDLGPIVAKVSRQSLTSSYLDQAVLPDLEERLRAGWPFPPEVITVVDGAMDALDRVAQVVVRLGDRVVVEHPTFPPLLDLLELLGAEVIGVGLDREGIVPAELAGALTRSPAAIFLQPRAHNPSGITATARRTKQLAAMLAKSNAVIVEDDHSGDIASGALVSLGRHLPQRTVHIRSYSKSHGPDLRLAAIGGAGDVVTAVANRRLLGPGWSSRILQAVLRELLDNPATARQLDDARAEYAERRALVTDVLAARGVGTTGTDGINLWIDVADERSALLALAAQGIGAAPGEPFTVPRASRVATGVEPDHLRVTVGLLGRSGEHVPEQVAEQLAAAATGRPFRSGQR